MDARKMRSNFVAGLFSGLRVVWPILSGLIGLMIVLGLVVGMREGWSIQESIYFACIRSHDRLWRSRPEDAVGAHACCFIGVCGVLFTALLAGVAVKALDAAHDDDNR